MTAETETKSAEQIEDKKEITKEEEAEKAANEKKAEEKSEKEKKETTTEKKEEKPKKEAPAPKPSVHKIDYEKDIVYLYQFTRTPVLPSLSPYCLKVETWLRLVGLKYENIDHRMKYKSKKGQLPFVEVNGEEVADSAIIVKDLGLRFNQDLDAGLTSEQKNIVHANISMIENHFAWVVKWWRCKYHGEWVRAAKLNLQQALNTRVPNAVLNFAFKLRYRQAAKKVRAHGIGVHKPEEIEEFGRSDLQVLSDLLGDKPFFFGETPSTLDVVAFANLAQVVFMSKDVSYGLRDWMNENCFNLNDFCERMKERAFPDWEEMCTNLDLNSHLPKPPPPAPKEEEEKKEAEEVKEEKKEEKETEKEADKDKETEKNGEKKEEKVEEKKEEEKVEKKDEEKK